MTSASDLDDIAPVIGYRATRILQAWYPGKRLHVPAPRNVNGHPLVKLIGASALAALVREFAGERLWIPSSDEDDRYRRDRNIAEALAEGASAAVVARSVGLSTKRVQEIRAELVDAGWLTYAQGFDTAMARTRGRWQRGRDEPPPEILGTGEESGEPPGSG